MANLSSYINIGITHGQGSLVMSYVVLYSVDSKRNFSSSWNMLLGEEKGFYSI